MSTPSAQHVGSAIRGYLATIYLGLFLATSLVPQGYMPFVNYDGSIQIVTCSGTDKRVLTEDRTNRSTYDCPFSLLQLSILPYGGSSPFPADKSLLELSYLSYNHPERNYQTALPRGPPSISWLITKIFYSGETHENHINWTYSSPNFCRELCDEQRTQ